MRDHATYPSTFLTYLFRPANQHPPGPLPRVPAEYVAVAGLDEDVVAADVVQDLVRRRRGQVGQGVTLRLTTGKSIVELLQSSNVNPLHKSLTKTVAIRMQASWLNTLSLR